MLDPPGTGGQELEPSRGGADSSDFAYKIFCEYSFSIFRYNARNFFPQEN
jgi:hypothetical protein